MGNYTVFFIGFFTGIVAGAGLIYGLAHNYLTTMIEKRTNDAIETVFKERDLILKKAREDAVAIQDKLEKAKQNLADRMAGK